MGADPACPTILQGRNYGGSSQGAAFTGSGEPVRWLKRRSPAMATAAAKTASMHAPAIRHLVIGGKQHHPSCRIGHAKRQYLGSERPDLAGAEIDDRHDLPPDQRRRIVMFGNLGRALLHPDLRSEIKPELEGRFPCLLKGPGIGDRARADRVRE